MSNPPVEVEFAIEPISNHTSTLIFLHGLGDSDHGWSSAFECIQLPNMKIVCPNAPSQPVAKNGGFRVPSWFDFKRLDIPFAGIVTPSSWLPLHQQFPEAKLNSDNVPIFQIHGGLDPIVCYESAQLTACILLSFMKNVVFKTYCGLLHTGSDAVMNAIKHVVIEWMQ
ncbi:hypothetical protein GQX74_013832 [Glossina fuscipes]|nr:hypothetical protein GQX74_013832 [Glossina fuscipes]